MAFFLKFLINHPKSTLLSTLLFCVFLSFFAFKLHIDASAESLLLEDDKDLKIFRELSKHYKSDNFLMLAFKPNDKNPFSEESLKNLESLHQKLEGVRGVERVFSIINAPLLLSSENKDLKELMQNIPSILSEDINQTKAQNEILTSPFYLNNIIAKDGKTTALIIYLKPDLTYINLIEARDNAKDENEKEHLRIQIKNHQEMQNALNKALLEQIRSIMSAYEKDGKLYLGGVSMISDDMISYIKDDLALYGIFLVFLLGFALWYFFRSFTLMILSLLICFISLSSASGLFALLNFPITVISSNYAPLMLIITLSVVVHLITHFIEISRLYPNTTQKRLVLQTLLSKAKPSFFAIFTTMIGFFSLIFSQIEPIIKLGIMMSLGIALGLILAYLFLASALVLLKRKNFTQREFNLSFLLFCANASIRHRKLIYTLAFITIILALIGIPKLKVENSFVNYFKDGSAIKEGLLVIDKDLGGTLPLDIIVRFKDNKKNELKESEVLDSFENEFESLAAKDTYWFDSKKTRIAKKVHQFLENKEFVGSVLSLNSLLMLGKNINEGKDLDDFALAFLNENLPENFKQDLLSPFVNITQNELKFSIRVIDSNPNLKRDTFLKSLKTELNELLKDEGVEVQITGIMLLYNNMLQSLFSSQFDTLAFVVLAIFVLFVLIFRSFKIATIAIVCNLIPLSLVFAFMGFLNIPLDLMSITIAAIAIGIGVDDILHYIYRFKEELKCASVKKAVLNSHLFIGTALYYTTISIVLGFSVMMSSNFIPTIYFGILTTLVMILLLFGSLFLLPSLLISFYAKKNNKPKLLR
ncbi:RND family transporter [Campylobacter helveticus]|uniref:RND family transporter n=2 Tax=Campylobacter helveticus TaxID=28898 RepID=A0AAX2ULM0_9BACT|nr:MMPL family transporter [Campylobacter helveticus]QBL11850.1 RND family transporter [Campylobacter helveticus]TNB55051.1 RND family transporter [Campylobacter helveticus]TNB58231.1 RND family transporter [Campylobacter helveticus]TNH36905.1 RND family transporter [Campylobacter helveticus]TXK54375.1 RND family transporter [Campylobacter helveticus]